MRVWPEARGGRGIISRLSGFVSFLDRVISCGFVVHFFSCPFVCLYVCNVVLLRVFRVFRGSAFIKRTTNRTKHTKKNTKQKGLKFSDNFLASWFGFENEILESLGKIEKPTTKHTKY